MHTLIITEEKFLSMVWEYNGRRRLDFKNLRFKKKLNDRRKIHTDKEAKACQPDMDIGFREKDDS